MAGGPTDYAGKRAETLAAAAVHEREGRLGEAERLYRALLAADGGQLDTLLHLATVGIAQGKLDDGERLLRQCAARGPTSPANHARIAAGFLALRRPDDAIAQSRLALAVDPTLVEALITLGSACQALKRQDDAIDAYRRALAVDPENVAAHFNLATASQALNHHEDAIASYERVLAADPEIVEAHYGIGIALIARDRGADAVVAFERALAADPEFAEAAVALARTLQSLGRHEDAIPRYDQALDVDPDFADARGGLASAFQALGRHVEAIGNFEALCAAEPDHPMGPRAFESYRAHGRDCVAAKRYEEAFAAFEKMLALRPDDPHALADYALALSSSGRVDDAVARYRQAVVLEPDHAQLQVNLGAALVLSGRIEEARGVFERAMALAPDDAEPYLALAGMRRMTRGDPLLPAMEQLADRLESQGGPDAIKLNFALGKAYGDIGEHERSFRRLIAGNALMRRTLTYDEAETVRFYERIRDVFTAEFLERRAGGGDPSTVPVFIVGFPRSGSTLVEQILASHPDLFGAGERTNFIDAVAEFCPGFPDAASMPDATLRRLGAHYVADLARPAPEAARITDKLLGNFPYVGLIRLALPNARIIRTHRDPVETCLSCFSTFFGPDTVPYSYDLGELGRSYRAYAAMMDHWHRVLPAGAMIEVRYEDVVADFEQQARRIIDYCGLAWDDACLSFHETQRVVRTASAFQVRQPIYQSSVRRARPEGDALRPLLDALG